MKRSLWVLFPLGLLFASPARAQLGTMREHARQMDSGKLALGADLNTFFGRVDSAGYAFFQPTALASLRLGEAVFEAALPLAYFHQNNDPGEDHDQLSLGNPWVGLAYLPDTYCGLARLSLGIAPPVATASTPRHARALSLARAVTGSRDVYLWVDDMLPLVLGAGTLKELSMLRLAWDADVAFGLPGSSRDVELGLESSGELALRIRWHTQLGARVAGAYYPTIDTDRFQSALTFFVRHARPTGESFGMRFVMNLDPPLGFSFSPDGVWGLGLFCAAPL